MRPLPTIAIASLAVVAGLAVWQVADADADGTRHVTPYSTTGEYAEGVSLVSGRLITPVGRRTELGDFPVVIAVSPDRTLAAIANSGQGEGAPQQTDESIQLVDLASGTVLQTVHDHEEDQPTFYESGLAWSPDGEHLYATGGGNDQVYDYAYDGSRISLVHRWKSSVRAGAPTVPGTQSGGIPGTAPLLGDAAAYSRGLDVLPDGSAVLVTNEQGSTVAALSTTDGTLLWETTLGGAGQPAGAYPEAVAVGKGGRTAYVVAQGLNAVVGLDTGTGLVTSTTPVGDHPVSVALGGHGKQLYVTNANDDSLTVLDVSGAAPTEVTQVSTHLVPHEANGSTPDAVTVDDATHTVYVANAGDNAVMVLRGAGDRLHTVGAIPSGWYPAALAQAPHGRLLVASAKGLGGAPITSKNQYIANRRHGLLTTVHRPSSAQLADWTREARHNLRYPSTTSRLRPAHSPIPTSRNAGNSPIKHVVLIVRENRTFDQVFGDLKRHDADVEPAYTRVRPDQRRRSDGDAEHPRAGEALRAVPELLQRRRGQHPGSPLDRRGRARATTPRRATCTTTPPATTPTTRPHRSSTPAAARCSSSWPARARRSRTSASWSASRPLRFRPRGSHRVRAAARPVARTTRSRRRTSTRTWARTCR